MQALQAEIARLNKVVEALMDRSESSMNVQGSDFGLFQTTVMLQDQVRLRSEELEAAVRDAQGDTSGSRAAAPRDMQTLRRTAALQIQLLELVVQQKDVGELIERVAAILDHARSSSSTLAGGSSRCSRSAADAPDLAAADSGRPTRTPHGLARPRRGRHRRRPSAPSSARSW